MNYIKNLENVAIYYSDHIFCTTDRHFYVRKVPAEDPKVYQLLFGKQS